MNKKLLIALADTLRTNKPNPENTQAGSPQRDYVNGRLAEWEMLRDRLADFCADHNQNFKRQRWLDYTDGKCGPNGGPIRT